MEKYYGLLRDSKDDRDYKANHILGVDSNDIPGFIDLSCVKPMDQGKTAHCTSYGLSMVHSILQTLEHKKSIALDPEEQWTNQRSYPATASEEIGDYLRSALRSLKRYGLSNPDSGNPLMYHVDGYAVLENTPEDFCKHLAKGLPIYTGSNVTKTNFRNAKYEGRWTGNDGERTGGHAFMIVGYNLSEEYFIAINSHGEDWGFYNNGTFRIKFEDIKDLFRSYILFDTKDIKQIYRDVSEDSPMADAIKFCLEGGYMKGYGDETDSKDRYFKPDQPVTRAEMAQIIMNLKTNS